MQRNVKYASFLASILALTTLVGGCSSAPAKPDWLYDPDRDQAVGHCGPHALGKHKQKECAETRARIELARRQGVTLKNISVMTESAGSRGNSSQMDQQTLQEVNTKVKARVVDTYYDQSRDEIWVLVEEN